MSVVFDKTNIFSQICRICVKHSETLRCISESDISENLQLCSDISTSMERGLPDKICYSCQLLLQATCRFKNLCKTAAEKLNIYVLNSSLTSDDFTRENYKSRKKEKKCVLWEDKRYAVPEYVEVKHDTEEYFLEDAVPELNVVESMISDSDMDRDKFVGNENENRLEPVEISLNDIANRKIYCELECDTIVKSEHDNDNTFGYDPDKSDYSNYDSDESYKPKIKRINKKKVKIKSEMEKNIHEKTNYHLEDYDEKSLFKERKSKTTPPKSKRKIFVAKIIPTRQDLQQSNKLTLDEEEISKFRAKSLQCFLCEEVLENTSKLRKHLLYHERNKNKFVYKSLDLDPNEKVLCEICGLALQGSSALQVHSMVHAENFPFHCKLCPHRTNQAISLKVHMRKHTGEKPYACPHCQNVFSTSSNRLKHIRIKHTTGQERPFQCDICKRHCSSKVTLENHLDSIHYKIKKHYCEHCNSGFYSRKRMLIHRRKVHNVSAEVKGRVPSYIQKEREKSTNKVMTCII